MSSPRDDKQKGKAPASGGEYLVKDTRQLVKDPKEELYSQFEDFRKNMIKFVGIFEELKKINPELKELERYMEPFRKMAGLPNPITDPQNKTQGNSWLSDVAGEDTYKQLVTLAAYAATCTRNHAEFYGKLKAEFAKIDTNQLQTNKILSTTNGFIGIDSLMAMPLRKFGVAQLTVSDLNKATKPGDEKKLVAQLAEHLKQCTLIQVNTAKIGPTPTTRPLGMGEAATAASKSAPRVAPKAPTHNPDERRQLATPAERQAAKAAAKLYKDGAKPSDEIKPRGPKP